MWLVGNVDTRGEDNTSQFKRSGFNASYGDLPYKEKREHYLTQNLLAQSLHERAYEHNVADGCAP